MRELNFYLDGRNESERYNINYNPEQARTPDIVNVYVEDGFGDQFSSYSFQGVGPSSGDSADTFNLILPKGWDARVVDVPEQPDSFYWEIRDDAGNERSRIEVRGGAEGKITNVCFPRGAMVATPLGQRAIETLAVGDLVLTRDRGAQPIRWIGSTLLSAETLRQFPEKRPVRIAAGALGDHAATEVSPHHRILVAGWRADTLFDAPEVLAAAVHLVNDRTITRAPAEAVEYFHILLDGHEILCVDGLWSESFHPGAVQTGLAPATRDEVLELFPALETAATVDLARPQPEQDDLVALLF